MNNLELWSAVETTDIDATKPFNRGGGFRGTAVNATYLARRATEQFGPMGIGWGLEILDESIMEGIPLDDKGVREKIHKVRVKLWYKLSSERGRERGEVIQFGQTTFVGRNKFGLFTDEEAPKKSLTDAMSKCLSLLGFSADVYLGRFDDNKYVAQLREEKARQHQEESLPAHEKPISKAQINAINECLEYLGDKAKTALYEKLGIECVEDMQRGAYAKVKKWLDDGVATKKSKEGK